MAEVVLEGVRKVYPGDVTALQDVSFRVGEGELVILLGPSGCGKTTVLRVIAGLEDATEGTVRIGGRLVNDVPPRGRDVAMVFQDHALYPHLSVRENLAFGLRLRCRSSVVARACLRLVRPQRYWQLRRECGMREACVQNAARMLELEGLLERKPWQLSGGQRQRVALGRAIVRQPKVFLLDEPLSHLDAQMRVTMRRQLHDLHRRLAATTIYVTHDQSEAMTLGQRITVMDQGVIQQTDTPAAVYDRPRNRFVAGFIGSPPMNFLQGRLVLFNGTVCFRTHCLSLPMPVERAWQLKDLPPRAVTLGIRPQDVHLCTDPRLHADWTSVAGKVSGIEPLGDETIVHLRVGTEQLVGKGGMRDCVRPDESIPVALDMSCVHLFDASSGLSLLALQKGVSAG